MKRFAIAFLVLGLFSCINGPVSAQDIPAESKITQVTVYPGEALVTRLASLKLSPGGHKAVFAGIVPEIDENSLRVSGGGSAEFKILGAKLKKEFLQEAPEEKVRQLQEEIQKLTDETKRIRNNQNVLSEERRFLDSVRLFSEGQIPKDLVTKMPPAKELEDTLKFLSTRLKENYAQLIDTELSLRELGKKMDVLRRELTQVSGPNRKLKRSIEVELEVLKPGNLDLSVSYLVLGASWEPIYDARADFDKSQVELISHGIISQNTGEDWQDVQMYLSTAKPAVGGSMPYVAPWFIRPYQPPALGAAKDGMMLRKLDMSVMTQTAAFGGAGAVMDEMAPEEKEANKYAVAEEKGVAVVYKLAGKATIKSDGAENKLPISSQALAAKFEYSSYPRSVLSAYLGSRVTNAPNLQLLSGRVNIFLAGDFVGTSNIGNIGPGEEFDLYLGADENVKVKRELTEKKVDETIIAGIPSPNKRTTFKYKFTVENYKSKKINVKLFEAMPVSEDDRIKVKIDKVSLEPKEKDWKDRKGVWLWELGLEPKGKQEIFCTYTIEHPRDMQIEGL